MERCICSLISNGGDMAPRLWECPEHGITGMIGPMFIIEKAAETYTLLVEDAKLLAFDELKRLQKAEPFRNNACMYFCEDYFGEDLTNYFERTFNKE